jgi:hypothetical protein
MHYFWNSFWLKNLYMFWTDLLFIIRSLSIVYKAIGICHASYVDLPASFILTSLADSQHN